MTRKTLGHHPKRANTDRGVRLLFVVAAPWIVGALLVFVAGAVLGLALRPGDDRSAGLVFVLGILPFTMLVAWYRAAQHWYGDAEPAANETGALDLYRVGWFVDTRDQLVAEGLLAGAVALACYLQLVVGHAPEADPLRYASFGLIAASALLWLSVWLFRRPRWILPAGLRQAAGGDRAEVERVPEPRDHAERPARRRKPPRRRSRKGR